MTSFFPPELVDEAKALLDDLQRHSLSLTTAESCTGGLLAGLLTEVPGASATLERGFVTYSNAAKIEMLGVDPGLIERHGAVSRDVARAMAEGALAHAHADLALSITGIAGPDGGTADKPVGLVCLAVASRRSPTVDQECRYGDLGRTGIRLATLHTALGMVRAEIP